MTVILEQILRRDIGCSAYLVGSEAAGEAAVVDPRIDMIDEIVALAEHDGLRIRYIVETHNHADHSDLSDAYAAAIQNAVTPNWLRPDNMPAVPCQVHIVQLPGGDVMSATVDPSCPYDEAGRRSVENAVLRTKTLPYAGFESVFRRNLTFTFRPQ